MNYELIINRNIIVSTIFTLYLSGCASYSIYCITKEDIEELMYVAGPCSNEDTAQKHADSYLLDQLGEERPFNLSSVSYKNHEWTFSYTANWKYPGPGHHWSVYVDMENCSITMRWGK